jgi:hypothetical protein
MNKLAGIWNVWDGDEHLRRSIEQIKEHLDFVIVVYQNISNIGEKYFPELPHDLIDMSFHYQPNLLDSAQNNEENKRNIGLSLARQMNCTHFIHLDCDEMYFNEDFKLAKEECYKNNLDASFCSLKTYYKYPTKQLFPEEPYFVPFIHKIYPHTKMCFDKRYPAFVDPTRRTNTYINHKYIDWLKMHHYSFVRKDIERKMRNSSSSSAFSNNSVTWEEFDKTGKMIHFKDFITIDVENYFNL